MIDINIKFDLHLSCSWFWKFYFVFGNTKTLDNIKEKCVCNSYLLLVACLDSLTLDIRWKQSPMPCCFKKAGHGTEYDAILFWHIYGSYKLSILVSRHNFPLHKHNIRKQAKDESQNTYFGQTAHASLGTIMMFLGGRVITCC